jgi:hypothetical protein
MEQAGSSRNRLELLTTSGFALIDGRNRLAACGLAGVEPRYERLVDQDPEAFIVSVNLARRNMSKGQQAMALAMILSGGGGGRSGQECRNQKGPRVLGL